MLCKWSLSRELVTPYERKLIPKVHKYCLVLVMLEEVQQVLVYTYLVALHSITSHFSTNSNISPNARKRIHISLSQTASTFLPALIEL